MLFHVLVTRYSSASPSVSSIPPSSSDEAATTLAPVRSSTSCSYHLFATHIPSIRTVSSKSSVIVCVEMYCTTVFCLFSTYASISSKTASCISVSRSGYCQIPSNNLRGFLPVICWDNLCWNPPRDRPVRGVTTQVSTPKNSTACPTTLENIPDTLGFTPSLPKIIARRVQLLLAFHRFSKTYGQSASKAVMILPKYLKDMTDSSGMP